MFDDKPCFIGGKGTGLDALFTNLSQQNESLPEEIEEKARNSAEKAIQFFRTRGIDLGYVPKVKYTAESCKFNPNVAAVVDAETEYYKNVIGLVGATLIKTVYNKQFGLKLSDVALAECVEVGKKEFGIMFPNGLFNQDADIILFNPIKNELDSLDELMGHEVWHLIEQNFGLMDPSQFIHEGTATFVQNQIAGRKSEWKGTEGNYIDLVHYNMAHLVETEIKGADKPFSAILNPKIRANLQARFDEKILPLFYEKAAAIVIESGQGVFKQIVLTHPAYEAFRNNPSQDNVLKALRQRGYVKMADEFAAQDMTKLVQYNKHIVNPPEIESMPMPHLL